MDLPISPTFASEVDIQFIEPMANYFPPVLESAVHLPDDLDSDSNLCYESEKGEK
jgi:hypothetical protein